MWNETERRRDGEVAGNRRKTCVLLGMCCVCFQLGSLALFRPPSQTSGLNCQGNTTPVPPQVQPSLYYCRQACLWSG